MNASDVRSRIQVFRETLRWRGPVRCAVLAVRELLRPIFDWYVFHVGETVLTKETATAQKPSGFVVKIFTRADGIEWVESPMAELQNAKPVDISLRLKRGGAVAVAFAGDKAVGCTWMTLRSGLPMPFQLTWVVKPKEAVLYGSFVLPNWRGNRLHQHLDAAINAYLYGRGFLRTLGSVSAMNSQSLRLTQRTNKRITMTLILVRVRGLNWNFRFALGEPLESQFQIDSSTVSTIPAK